MNFTQIAGRIRSLGSIPLAWNRLVRLTAQATAQRSYHPGAHDNGCD